MRPLTGGPGMEPLRVAIVGLGWAAHHIWLPRLCSQPGLTLAAIVDPDPRARARAAAAGSGEYARADDLPAAEVDLAVVAAPNHLHAGLAETLLRKGIAVFVEKPVCLSSAEADRLAEAEFSAGAVLLAGSAARYRADVRALLDAAGEIGPIRHLCLRWVRARGIPGAGWFTSRRLSGGGALMDLGWHLLDAVTPLLGPAKFRQVVGSVSGDFIGDASGAARWRDHEHRETAGDVEDTARGFLLSQRGPSVSLDASWASHRADDLTSITAEGSSGTLTLTCTFGFSPDRQQRSVLTLARRGKETELPVPDEPVGIEYDRLLADLPRRLAHPASGGSAIREAARTIDTFERLYACAKDGTGSQDGVAPLRPHRLRAVLFDLDGVLVDSFEVMRQAFTLAYRDVVGAGEPPFREYNRHLGRYFPDIMRIMGLPAEMEAPFVRESSRLAGQVTLFPGIAELLRSLRQRGLRLAVATGKSGWRARSLLRRLGVLGLFDYVIGSDEVPSAKPAPDIVIRALDLLRVSPNELIMVGDALSDLAAARAAGVAAAAALWGETDEVKLLAAEPDLVLRDPAELAAMWQPVTVLR